MGKVRIKAKIASVAGEAAAKMICAALAFEVQEIRPLRVSGKGGKSRSEYNPYSGKYL